MNTHSFGVFKVDNDHWEGVDGQDEDVEDVESEVFDVEKPNAVVCLGSSSCSLLKYTHGQ